MKPFLKLKPVDEVIELIYAFTHLSPEETPLAKAQGRFLASDFYAPNDLPGFARSLVDGYAIRAKDIYGATEISPALLEVTGLAKMGEHVTIPIDAGDAIAISTGAMLPTGADCATMIEYTRSLPNNLLEVTRSLAPGDNIVTAQEDAAKGQLLLKAGHFLEAQDIGLFAAFGKENVKVFRQAKVGIYSSGDEIIPITKEPQPGQIRDINSWVITTLCKKVKALPEFMGILKDDKEEISRALEEACGQFDVIVISGGSSAGRRDLTLEVFANLPNAKILVHGVAISPGKPLIMAQSGTTILLGLPGHVIGSYFASRIFLLPLLCRLQGQAHLPPQSSISAILSRSIASTQGRRDYIRCKLENANGTYIATPIVAASALITGLTKADGYIICPENREGLYKEEQVAFYLF